VMRRFSVFSRSGMLSSSTMAAGDIAPQHALQLSVRIGIATGRLPCGCDLNNCAVKDKAKSEWITCCCATRALLAACFSSRCACCLQHSMPNLPTTDVIHTVMTHEACAVHVVQTNCRSCQHVPACQHQHATSTSSYQQNMGHCFPPVTMCLPFA
jgi:hypothetical protein